MCAITLSDNRFHMSIMETSKNEEIDAATRAWVKALADHDVDALLACYAVDATLESPVAAHILGGRGVAHSSPAGLLRMARHGNP
jgi:ketosteroid isomerase-like protein